MTKMNSIQSNAEGSNPNPQPHSISPIIDPVMSLVSILPF